MFNVTSEIETQLQIVGNLNPSQGTWDRLVSWEGEIIFEKDWDFRYLHDTNFNFPFSYEYNAIDESGQEYHFKELLDLYETHEDLYFEVVTKGEVYSGKLTLVYDDPYNQMVYFGSVAKACPFDWSTGYCSVNITDPETGFS